MALSVGERRNKQWYIQAMEYYKGLKRNERSSNEKTQMKFKCVVLGKKSQSKKAVYYIIPPI